MRAKRLSTERFKLATGRLIKSGTLPRTGWDKILSTFIKAQEAARRIALVASFLSKLLG